MKNKSTSLKAHAMRKISDTIKSTVTYYPYAGNKDFKFTLIISNKSTITSTQQHFVERKTLDSRQVQRFKDLLKVLNVFTPIKLNESCAICPLISQKLTIKSKGLSFVLTWTNADEINYESHLVNVVNLVTALQLEFSPEGLGVLKAGPPGIVLPEFL